MKVENADPESLSIHPLLQRMPDPDSELMTSIANDVVENGIRDPLIVDEKDRVISGRIRLRVALQVELATVPICRAPSTDAATIIVQSLLQRRHYSKSALAYLVFPFFEQMLEEARRRRVDYLKSDKSAAVPSNSTQNVLFLGPKAEDVARQAGVSRALFFQAAEVHKLFAKHPEAKKQLEAHILSGELSLGYAINGVAGMIATKGKARGAAHQLELFSRSVNALRIRFSKWNAIPENRRLFIANEFAEAIAEAPEEIQEQVRRRLSRKAASV